MASFLVVLRRSGPAYDPALPVEQQLGWAEHAAFMDGLVEQGTVALGGPLADDLRVVLAVEGADLTCADDVRRVLAPDPWHPSHLEVSSIEAWTIRLRRGAI